MLLDTEQVVGYVNYSLIVSGIFIIFCICMFLYCSIKHLLFLWHTKKYQIHECKCIRCGSIFYDKNIKVVCDKCLNQKESNNANN